MNRFEKLTIGGSITALISLLVLRFNDLISDQLLLWIGLGVVLTILAVGAGWTVTEGYKRIVLNEEDWSSKPIQRKIFIFAWISSLIFMNIALAVFFLLTDFHWRTGTAFVIAWEFWALLMSGFSPYLWKWVFERALPAVGRRILRREPIIKYDDAGAPTGIKLDEMDQTIQLKRPSREDL